MANGIERFKKETGIAYAEFEAANDTQLEQAHRRFAQRNCLDVASDADDFEGTLPIVITKAAPNCVFARPKCLRHRFAYDCDFGGVFAGVVFGEIPSPQNRNAHSFKVSGSNGANVGNLTIALGVFVAAFRHNGTAFTPETERHELAEIGTAHLWIAPHLLDNVASNLAAALLIVTGKRGIDTNDD